MSIDPEEDFEVADCEEEGPLLADIILYVGAGLWAMGGWVHDHLSGDAGVAGMTNDEIDKMEGR